MLHSLISEITQLFETQFKRTAISASPLPESYADLPAIAIYAGLLTALPGEANQPLQPRRVPVAQKFNLTTKNRGPFPLDHRPLKGSLSATHIATDQTKQSLVDPVHVKVERNNQTITFTQNAPETGTVLVSYDFTGLALVQEFDQLLCIEVRATEMAQAERLGSLAAAIVLTSAEELARCSSNDLAEPHVGHFRANVTIGNITLKTAVPGRDRYILHFNIRGQLKMIREMN